MEDKGHTDGDREEIYANAVRAGKRTYFFDVRKTRGEDYYLTITESKRKYNEDGTFFYQKHKVFLYKEDFEKFSDALTDSIKKIISLKNEHEAGMVDKITNNFTDVNFEDLGTESRSNGISDEH
jgi:hypothetical protein